MHLQYGLCDRENQAPRQTATVSALVEAIGEDLWAKTIAPRPLDIDDAIETRLCALAYRALYGWTALSAWRGTRQDTVDVCDCPAGARCDKPGKHPTMSWREEIMPAAPSVVRTLIDFLAYSRNIAILTGKRSGGLVVGDVDPRSGGRLEALWDLGWPRETPIEQTGGGGWHVYCRADDLRSVDAYAPGIEVKSEGKLVIASPSLHVSGRRYAWLDGHAPWEIALAPLPDHVVEDIRTRPANTSTSSARLGGEDRTQEWRDIGLTREQVRQLALKRYRKAIWKVREQDEHRKNTMYWLARQLQSLGMPSSDIFAWVEAFGELVKNG